MVCEGGTLVTISQDQSRPVCVYVRACMHVLVFVQRCVVRVCVCARVRAASPTRTTPLEQERGTEVRSSVSQ